MGDGGYPTGFIAVHILRDAALVSPGDVVLIGSPVGTSRTPITATLECRARGAYIVALTNVEFENHPEALSILRASGVTPRLYECVNIEGARERNAGYVADYVRTDRGYFDDGDPPAPD